MIITFVVCLMKALSFSLLNAYLVILVYYLWMFQFPVELLFVLLNILKSGSYSFQTGIQDLCMQKTNYRTFSVTRGVLIIATPYASGFDHFLIADEVQFKFDRCYRLLQETVGFNLLSEGQFLSVSNFLFMRKMFKILIDSDPRPSYFWCWPFLGFACPPSDWYIKYLTLNFIV